MNLDYEVRTRCNAHRIEQEVCVTESINGTVTTLSRHLVDLQEQGIRDALIALGWTPPKDRL